MEIRAADCPLGAKCEEVKEEGGRQILYRCPWYVAVRGTSPNTGADVDEWGCAIAWGPLLAINSANAARSGAAATESFRNEMVNQGAKARQALAAISQAEAPQLMNNETPALEHGPAHIEDQT